MVLSILFIQAPVSQRSKLLGRHNQIFIIPKLTQCFRKYTILKYLSYNYLYLSFIKCIVIPPIFILLSHTSTSTCIALKALISYLHSHTVLTLYYYMFSFNSISISIHLLAMEPHTFYIKCNNIKICNIISVSLHAKFRQCCLMNIFPRLKNNIGIKKMHLLKVRQNVTIIQSFNQK